MITSNNGPLRTLQEIGLEIARGNAPGKAPFGSFGELITAAVLTSQVIWPNGPYVFPPPGGVSIELVSTSINDTLAGTGIRKVEMHYLNSALEVNSVIIELNGTTPVTVDEDANPLVDVRFIQCLHVVETGTFGQGAVGDIVARTLGGAGGDFAFINIGNVRCNSSARMVPANKKAIVYGLVASSISGTAAARSKIQISATELDNHQYTDQGLFMPFGSVGVQDNSQAFVLPIPGNFKAGTIVAMLGSTDKAAEITGAWFGWLEDV